MAKEYLTVDGKLVMVNGELVQVPDAEQLNDIADENGAYATQGLSLTDDIEELIVNGVIDFQDNVAMVISQDAAISNSYEEAKEIIRKRNEEINKANKQFFYYLVSYHLQLNKNLFYIRKFI